jgi:hypothetical protein
VEIVQVREEWLLDPYFQLCVILVLSAAIFYSSWFQNLQICPASLVLFSVVSDQSFCCYSQQLLASESGVYPSFIAPIPC